MDREYEESLLPVGRQLKEALNRSGERVPSSAMFDPIDGRIWKKSPSGRFQEVTVDRKKVLNTIEHYQRSIEATRQRCSESRKERL
ncbi:MAG: hypothetical protein JW931_00755 [Methanomicrobiaceae archaeon]|nr:hypothetical protein [Methanomicrobiaceae archaeon]